MRRVGSARWAGSLVVSVVLLAACGVATTSPRPVNRAVPSTAVPATMVFPLPGGRLAVNVPTPKVAVELYFVRNGRLDKRLRSLALPEVVGEVNSSELGKRIDAARRQAVIDALLAGPTPREREEGTTSALDALVDLSAPSPIIVSAVEPGAPIFLNIRPASPPGSRDRLLAAYAQLVWTVDPDNGRGVRFQANENDRPVDLSPSSESATGLPVVYGSDYPCLRFGDCAPPATAP